MNGVLPLREVLYLHSDHSSWFETIWSIWSFSVQRKKLWVWIIRETLTLRDRQAERQALS